MGVWDGMGDLPTIVEATANRRFTAFVEEIEPRLRRALVGAVGASEAADATAEALAYAWANWPQVSNMQNPAGFLYRVGQTRSKRHKVPRLPAPDTIGLPDVEPRLVPALLALSERQRVAVWLVHGCDWTYAEAAEALGTSRSALGTHVSRGLARLRALLEDQ